MPAAPQRSAQRRYDRPKPRTSPKAAEGKWAARFDNLPYTSIGFNLMPKAWRRYRKELGLSSVHYDLIEEIQGYQYGTRQYHPTYEQLSDSMNLSVRYLKKQTKFMVEQGLLSKTVVTRADGSDAYCIFDFTPMSLKVDALFAAETGLHGSVLEGAMEAMAEPSPTPVFPPNLPLEDKQSPSQPSEPQFTLACPVVHPPQGGPQFTPLEESGFDSEKNCPEEVLRPPNPPQAGGKKRRIRADWDEVLSEAGVPPTRWVLWGAAAKQILYEAKATEEAIETFLTAPETRPKPRQYTQPVRYFRTLVNREVRAKLNAHILKEYPEASRNTLLTNLEDALLDLMPEKTIPEGRWRSWAFTIQALVRNQEWPLGLLSQMLTDDDTKPKCCEKDPNRWSARINLMDKDYSGEYQEWISDLLYDWREALKDGQTRIDADEMFWEE